jgi:hypothetical protein
MSGVAVHSVRAGGMTDTDVVLGPRVWGPSLTGDFYFSDVQL